MELNYNNIWECVCVYTYVYMFVYTYKTNSFYTLAKRWVTIIQLLKKLTSECKLCNSVIY